MHLFDSSAFAFKLLLNQQRYSISSMHEMMGGNRFSFHFSVSTVNFKHCTEAIRTLVIDLEIHPLGDSTLFLECFQYSFSLHCLADIHISVFLKIPPFSPLKSDRGVAFKEIYICSCILSFFTTLHT